MQSFFLLILIMFNIGAALFVLSAGLPIPLMIMHVLVAIFCGYGIWGGT